jgi:ADP-ribose pyrophosphatase YjhB (NUDIX family)
MARKEIITSIDMDIDSLVPGQSVDCVIIGFEENVLKILILKWKVKDEIWALPGGFIYKNENLDKAATRVLKERTGISLPFLEQFKTFGDINRRDVHMLKKNIQSVKAKGKIADWFCERFISTGYVSLVDIRQCDPQPDFSSEQIKWVSLEELPDLIFDHKQIVETAIRYIKNQINYLPIGMNLLPERFTMKQLQSLYEGILQKKLDRGNFQRKMLKLGIFIRHEKQLEGGAHKAPYLYSFDKEKYEKFLVQGFGFNA